MFYKTPDQHRTRPLRRLTPAPIMTTLKSAPGSGAGWLNIAAPGVKEVTAIFRRWIRWGGGKGRSGSRSVGS